MTYRETELFISNQAIYRYYFDRLRAIALAEFEYGNFPETCDAPYMERKTLENGLSAIYIPDGCDFLLSTALAPMSSFDGYGYPTEIEGIDFNGRGYPSHNFEILYDNTARIPIISYLDLYAKLLWECHQTFRSNLRQQITPYVLVGTKDSKLAIKNIMSQVYGFAPYIILKKGMSLDTVKAIGMDVDFKGLSILQSMEHIWKQALAILGISTGTTKRERELNMELALNRQGDMMAMQSRLLPRVEFVNRVNRRFGTNITVNFGSLNTEFNPLPSAGDYATRGDVDNGGLDNEPDGLAPAAETDGDNLEGS